MKKYFTTLLIIAIAVIFSFAQSSTKTTKKANKLFFKGDIRGAIRVLDKAIAKKKDLLSAYVMRSNLRMFSRNIPGAVSDLDRAIELAPTKAVLYAKRAKIKSFLRDKSAMADYDSAIKFGYETDKVLVGRGNFKRISGDILGSIEDYRAAIKLNPESPDAVNGLALSLQRNNQRDTAINLLRDFLRRYEEFKGRKPTEKSEDGRINLVGASITPEFDEAPNQSFAEMKNQLQLALNVAQAYTNLANMLTKKQDLDAALVTIEKALQINRQSFYPRYLRGKIFLFKKEYKKALKDFNFSIKRVPRIAYTYADRGITYLWLGEPQKAQKDFDKYLQLYPRGETQLKIRIEETKKVLRIQKERSNLERSLQSLRKTNA